MIVDVNLMSNLLNVSEIEMSSRDIKDSSSKDVKVDIKEKLPIPVDTRDLESPIEFKEKLSNRIDILDEDPTFVRLHKQKSDDISNIEMKISVQIPTVDEVCNSIKLSDEIFRELSLIGAYLKNGGSLSKDITVNILIDSLEAFRHGHRDDIYTKLSNHDNNPKTGADSLECITLLRNLVGIWIRTSQRSEIIKMHGQNYTELFEKDSRYPLNVYGSIKKHPIDYEEYQSIKNRLMILMRSDPESITKRQIARRMDKHFAMNWSNSYRYRLAFLLYITGTSILGYEISTLTDPVGIISRTIAIYIATALILQQNRKTLYDSYEIAINIDFQDYPDNPLDIIQNVMDINNFAKGRKHAEPSDRFWLNVRNTLGFVDNMRKDEELLIFIKPGRIRRIFNWLYNKIKHD